MLNGYCAILSLVKKNFKMLDTEEVDDDFFTPVKGTSLANIFGNVSKNTENTENDSLKYVPPKPQNIVPPKKKEQTKATECIFACALNAHKWSNNVYTSKGKLGFAILKIQKSKDHNIVLYDSSKNTLSSTTISPKLNVTIKNNTYISYFDSLQKYWSIYGTNEETNKIADILKSCGANIEYSTHTEKDPLKPKSETDTTATLEESEQQNRESDTDSSMNKKTKASILNRMANMGHSVLPIRALPLEKSSDSSDTNQIETQQKVRHKPVKTSVKRNSVENVVSEYQSTPEIHQKITTTKSELQRNVNVYDSQLMPITNTSVLPSSSNELGIFMSEQRISNSELRININRITDKVDTVLEKINKLQHEEKGTNLSTNILLKLLTEYENKIKIYEELLKSRGLDDKKIIENRLEQSNKNCEVESLQNKMTEINKENEEKSLEINNLQRQIKLLQDTYSQDNQKKVSKENDLLKKINNLEEALKMKSEELSNVANNAAASANTGNDNIEEKVKNIMNNTFQTISVNFENNENYSGEAIKRIIGTVIKKITMTTLSEL